MPDNEDTGNAEYTANKPPLKVGKVVQKGVLKAISKEKEA